MKWLETIKQKIKKSEIVEVRNQQDQLIKIIRVDNPSKENRCPICGYMLSKNLDGSVEIKCRRCKNVIKLIKI